MDKISLMIFRIVFFLIFYCSAQASIANSFDLGDEESEGMEGTGVKATSPPVFDVATGSTWNQFIDIDPTRDILDQLNQRKHSYSRTNLQKAITLFKKSLNIHLEAYGENHPNVADNYYNLGSTYHELEQYEKAINYYLKALPIFQTAEKDKEIIILYNKLSLATLQNTRELKKARNYLEKALDFVQTKQSTAPDHKAEYVLIAITWYNLGNIWIETNNSNKALHAFKNADRLLTKQLPSDHPLMQKLATLLSSMDAISNKTSSSAE